MVISFSSSIWSDFVVVADGARVAASSTHVSDLFGLSEYSDISASGVLDDVLTFYFLKLITPVLCK